MEKRNVRQRVAALAGDITVENLDMNPSDLEYLCSQPFVVIHAAESVRFDEPLTAAMKTNVQGLMNVLDVAGKMIHLLVRAPPS